MNIRFASPVTTLVRFGLSHGRKNYLNEVFIPALSDLAGNKTPTDLRANGNDIGADLLEASLGDPSPLSYLASQLSIQA